jgi:hypothetical protein
VKIVVHIDRLALEGMPLTSAQSPRLRRAIERELSRLLSSGGIATTLSHGGALPRIDAPTIRFGARERPEALGRRIAGAVYGGIGRGPPL